MSSLLARLHLHLGPAAYAEPFAPHTLLKMPANALVNLAYLLVAAGWLAWALRRPDDDPRRPVRARFMGLALLAGIYAPIQFWRITTQQPLAAMVDQWVTLPFFGAFCAWALELLRPAPRPGRRFAAILAGSTGSYALAFAMPHGFVLALAVHITAALALGIALVRRTPSLALPFAAALLCCVGFVALKEADFALATCAPFRRLTGHFWSKLCDAGQLHFALLLFARARAGHEDDRGWEAQD